MTPLTTSSRRIIAGVLAAVVGLGAYWWFTGLRLREAPLALQGNVEVRQVNLGFKFAGRIKQMLVDEGASVIEGQALALLDKVYFEETVAQVQAQRDQAAATLAKMESGNRPEEIAQAQATVAEREAALVNAKVTLDRAQALLRTSAGTQKALDDAVAAQRQADAHLNSALQLLKLMQAGFRKEDVDLARGQLAEREAALNAAKRQLEDAELKAPSAGVVLSRVREAGAIVNAGETVFVLSLTTPVWIRTYVSELDLVRVKPGMEVEIRTDAAGIAPRRGQVGFISTTAEFTPKTVETRELRTSLVYRLRIVAQDPDGVLRQGMPVSVTLVPVSEPVKVSIGAK